MSRRRTPPAKAPEPTEGEDTPEADPAQGLDHGLARDALARLQVEIPVLQAEVKGRLPPLRELLRGISGEGPELEDEAEALATDIERLASERAAWLGLRSRASRLLFSVTGAGEDWATLKIPATGDETPGARARRELVAHYHEEVKPAWLLVRDNVDTAVGLLDDEIISARKRLLTLRRMDHG